MENFDKKNNDFEMENYNKIHIENLDSFKRNDSDKITNPFLDNMDDFNEDEEYENENDISKSHSNDFIIINDKKNIIFPKEIVDIMDDENKKNYEKNKDKIIFSIVVNGTHPL